MLSNSVTGQHLVIKDLKGKKVLSPPISLYECWDLLRHPLGRDHFLVKGSDDRNIITVDDVVTGVGTESLEEAKIRRNLALEYLPDHIYQLNHRNVKTLGYGLVHILLSLEGECDEDGVPVESVETKMTSLIGELILVGQLYDKCMFKKLIDSILPDNEFLFYTKYKFLKSIRSSFLTINDSSFMSGLMLNDGFHIVSDKDRSGIMQKFVASVHVVNGCVEKYFFDTISSKKPNPFTDTLLLVELIETKLVIFSKFKDIDCLLSIVQIVVSVENKSLAGDAHFVNAILRLILASPKLLVEFVEDPDDTRNLKNFLSRIKKAQHEPIVMETVSSILACLSPP